MAGKSRKKGRAGKGAGKATRRTMFEGRGDALDVLSPRAARWMAVVVALVSLAMGFAYLYSVREAPQFQVPVLDEASYDGQAMGILDGTWPGGRIFYQDPLYPYFLAAVYRVAGHRYRPVRIIQALLGALAVFLVFEIGLRAFGPPVGLMGAVFTAMYRPLYFFEGVLTKEVLCLALVCASLLTLLWSYKDSRAWKWSIPGLCLGAACLARANLLPVIAAWGLWIFLSLRRQRGAKHGVAAVLVFVGSALAAVSPATIHNVSAGDFNLVTSQGGQNFYLGNHLGNITGSYLPPDFVRANPRFEEVDFKREAEKITARKMKPSQVSSFWYGKAWDEIKEAPGLFFWRLWRKTELVVNNYEISDNVNFYYFRKRYSWILRLPTPGWGVIAALAIWGGILLVSRWIRNDAGGPVEGYPLFLLAGVYSLTLVAFYVFARYRMPLLAAAPSLAAFGLMETVGWAAKRHTGRFLAGMAIITALLFWTHRTIIKPEFDVPHYQTGNCLVKLGRFKEAEAEFREAIRLDPKRAAYHLNLGSTLYRLKRYEEALEEFQEAVRLEPRNVKALSGAGQTYSTLGRHKQAIRSFQAALLYGGDSSKIWTYMGWDYLALKNPHEAAACFRKALELDPSNEKAKMLLQGVERIMRGEP